MLSIWVKQRQLCHRRRDDWHSQSTACTIFSVYQDTAEAQTMLFKNPCSDAKQGLHKKGKCIRIYWKWTLKAIQAGVQLHTS